MNRVTEAPSIHSFDRIRVLQSTLIGLALAASVQFLAHAQEHRAIPLTVETNSAPGFTRIEPSRSGISFINVFKGDDYMTNAVAHNGAGVALGDLDQDGLPDLYFCALQGPNRLYRNLGGWRFEELDPGPAQCLGQISTGCTMADVDGDGDLDLLVNGIGTGTRLFLNEGSGKLVEKLDSGLSKSASATSIALADIDGDGDLDLYCPHFIDAMLLADPTTRFAVARKGDRWEVTRVNGESTRSPRWKDRFEALPDGKVRELPEIHGLYRNLGQGRFQPIEFEPGIYNDEQGKPIAPYRDWGLAAMFRDINGDGFPDLYVCNDNTSPDRIWINRGNGTFRALESWKIRHTSRSSMGVDFADLNRDGQLDFFVVDMLARSGERRKRQLVRDRPEAMDYDNPFTRLQFNRNTLFYGRADGTFAEAALFAGVAATDWSWTPLFMDVDLDGYEDLLVTNGFEFDVMDQDSSDRFKNPKQRLSQVELKRYLTFHPRWATPNAAFRNKGDGTFEPAGNSWGFDHEGVSYGMAQADLDGDGDLDLVVNNLNEGPGLYRNNASRPRVLIRLKGRAPNTRGVGARLQIAGGHVTQSQEMIAGGRYLSGDESVRMFSALSGQTQRLEVRWRSGRKTELGEVKPNFTYEVFEPEGNAGLAVPTTNAPNPLFVDVSSLMAQERMPLPSPALPSIANGGEGGQRPGEEATRFLAPIHVHPLEVRSAHEHSDEGFDEMLRQPSLPFRLGRLGPGVCFSDLDGDGWEDVMVAGGMGGKLAIYLNQNGKAFRKMESSWTTPGDQGALMVWPDGKGARSLLVTSSNYKLPPGSSSELWVIAGTNAAVQQKHSLGPMAPGAMASADIDGDGDLDLFVGGRLLPGRFPQSPSHKIFINQEGRLMPNEPSSNGFRDAGMVSGAVFADFDGDHDPDLALAVDWGPIRIFQNDRGQFTDATEAWGLADLTGRWNSIAAGDFDGDGRVDLVCGNAGRNSIYELYRPGPYRLYHGDWKGSGGLQIIESVRQGSDWVPMRDRVALGRDFPELAVKFSTHEEYASATVPGLLGDAFQGASWVEVSQLASCVLLNRGTKWQRVPLPHEAQYSMTYGIGIGDLDADGFEDIVLGQNHFGADGDLDRQDSGGLLWLRGKGDGRFEALHDLQTVAGPAGPQRGLALGDFNHDARVDVLWGQNNQATKILSNAGAKAGLRVELAGHPGNPDAVGAELRLISPGGLRGPVRCVTSGSGFLSQNASAQVLGAGGSAVWVRWPGGREQTASLSPNATSIRIQYQP